MDVSVEAEPEPVGAEIEPDDEAQEPAVVEIEATDAVEGEAVEGEAARG